MLYNRAQCHTGESYYYFNFKIAHVFSNVKFNFRTSFYFTFFVWRYFDLPKLPF